jgi:Fe-S-cluster containining protein
MQLRLLHDYEFLVDRADGAFLKVQKDYASCVKCKPGCTDCCNAVFGLFLIEAAYLNSHFSRLGTEERKAALLRCNDTERDLKRLQKVVEGFKDDPHMQAYAMARERVRCPLLDEQGKCVLYHFRPVTCRVYGIPTSIQGRAKACHKAGFLTGESYPLFDLDGIFRDLYLLSKELLESVEKADPEKASLLISVPKVITASLDEIIKESFQ